MAAKAERKECGEGRRQLRICAECRRPFLGRLRFCADCEELPDPFEGLPAELNPRLAMGSSLSRECTVGGYGVRRGVESADD